MSLMYLMEFPFCLLVWLKEFPSCLSVPEGVPIQCLLLALKEFPSCLLVYWMQFPFFMS